jgi:hypothetical protein
MTDGAPTPDAPAPAPGTSRLARALLARALGVLPRLPPAARTAPLDAVAAFTERPNGATYLAAHRALGQALRGHLVEAIAGATIRKAFADGVEALRRVEGMPSALADQLAQDLPQDTKAGARLTALAALLDTYEQLAGRIVEDKARLRSRWRAGGAARPRPPKAAEGRPPRKRGRRPSNG